MASGGICLRLIFRKLTGCQQNEPIAHLLETYTHTFQHQKSTDDCGRKKEREKHEKRWSWLYVSGQLFAPGCVCLPRVTEVSSRAARHSRTGQEVNRILESRPWHQNHEWTCEHLLQCSVGMKLNRAVVTQGIIMHRFGIFSKCLLERLHDLVNELHFDSAPATQGTLLQTSGLQQMHRWRGENKNCCRVLISHTSEASTGLLIDTNDSTLTSPGAEASGFQKSFSGLCSALEQILPIYWHFSTLPVTSTCLHFQPLSDGGQQCNSQPARWRVAGPILKPKTKWCCMLSLHLAFPGKSGFVGWQVNVFRPLCYIKKLKDEISAYAWHILKSLNLAHEAAALSNAGFLHNWLTHKTTHITNDSFFPLQSVQHTASHLLPLDAHSHTNKMPSLQEKHQEKRQRSHCP